MRTTSQLLNDTATLGNFVPTGMGYKALADLNGAHARQFLENNGFVVTENGDNGRCGYALTECGIFLSTNGYICRLSPSPLKSPAPVGDSGRAE